MLISNESIKVARILCMIQVLFAEVHLHSTEISLVLKGKDQGYFLSFDTGVTFPSGPVTLVTVPSGAGANNTGYFVLL